MLKNKSKITYKVGDLVKFTPESSIYNLFYEDYNDVPQFALIIKVRKLLKTVDIITQTENKLIKNVHFDEIEKIN